MHWHMLARPTWHHSSCITQSCSPIDRHHIQPTTLRRRVLHPICVHPTFITPHQLFLLCLLTLSTSIDALKLCLCPPATRPCCRPTSRTHTSTLAHSDHTCFEPQGLQLILSQKLIFEDTGWSAILNVFSRSSI